jgi:hypothetical protein
MRIDLTRALQDYITSMQITSSWVEFTVKTPPSEEELLAPELVDWEDCE